MITDERLRAAVQELEPVLGSQAKALWYKFISARTPERKESWRRKIKMVVQATLDKYSDKPILPPPSPETTRGELHLGNVIYPDRPYSDFGLSPRELTKHVLITGMTGTGKTTATLQIIDQLKRYNKNFLVFDWQREYKKLKRHNKLQKLKVLSVGREANFRFNPLCPPKGTDVLEWMAKLVDVINHAYLGGYGTEFILRDVLLKAYKHTKTLEGSGDYPNFLLVRQLLTKNFFKGRQDLWNQTAIRILENLTYQGGLGPTLNTERKTNLKALLKQDLILELDRLSNNDKTFLTEAIMLWIYEYRKNQGETKELRHVIIIEEAHNILSKAKERRQGGETVMETTLRMIRKFGQGVIVLDQEPSKVSESMKANTNTKITFTLGNGKDIQDISKSMELTKEQTKYLDILKVGQALVKIKGRIDKPILVKFPNYKKNQEWRYTLRE